MRQSNRRKQIVVNKPMQGRLIRSIALFPAISLAIIAIVTGIWCGRLLHEAMAADSDLPDLMPLVYMVVTCEFFAAVLLVANSLKVSHQVAGPAYRICRSIERMRNGDLSFKVGLRDHDHLTEIRDELNKLLDWLNENPPAGALTRQMAAENKTREKAAEAAEAAAAAAAAATAEPASTTADTTGSN